MDFVGLAREIEDRYSRYLKTTFYLRDPTLRASFDRALREGRLSKGPYLEVTPAYQRGLNPKILFPEIMGSSVESGFLDALDGERPLYWHQEEALRRIAAGRNIVVATGTGSGKTESFLYPILLHLYREFLTGTLDKSTGVRALILYPMNALAYDQRERLGRLHARLEAKSADFRFSFGQYIGATPEDKKDTYRHAADVTANRLSGELVFRQEMRETPPHILLTNFSMLEYQLLRPSDSPLFDTPHAKTWTFLVLDEAHQYRGTRGAEMALLLRRLKQRLRGGGKEGSFRCIATSASLVGGDDDRAKVAIFAANLFDEPFEAPDVILANTEQVAPTSGKRLPLKAYGMVADAISKNDSEALNFLERDLGFERNSSGSQPITVRAGNILSQDPRTAALRMLMAKGPQDIREISNSLFNDVDAEERMGATAALVGLLNRAEQAESRGPLLSVRYHMFLRALESAFVCYLPEKAITLSPQGSATNGGRSFELALCRECGQHYLVGQHVSGFFAEAVRDPSRDDFGVSFYLPIEGAERRDQDGTGSPEHLLNLCTECGAFWQLDSKQPCGHLNHIVVQKQTLSDEHPDQLSECGSCGYSGADPVREVIHGGDGPNAMIATTLYERAVQEPRKLLAFADSRQEAAYFAWYLDDTYQSILRRSMLYRSVSMQWARASEPLSLADMADSYRRLCMQEGLLDEAMAIGEQRRRAWQDVYREFLTQETRLSLSGVGLARIMHDAGRFCTTGRRSRASDPSVWIGLRPLLMQRV